MTYLIVGNGPAGTSAIERIRQIDKEGKIILVAAEANPPYSRIMTPEYMTGEVEEEDLYMRGRDFYVRHNVETRLGKRVARVLAEENTVLLDNGEKLGYESLLLATGSRPFVPTWIDQGLKGVFRLWDKADAEKIHDYLPKVKDAVIIGGGLVGLQAARALSTAGIKVTVVEMANRLMPAQLDEVAGEMLLKAMQAEGVKVLLGTEVKRIEDKNGRVSGVATAKETLRADMVIVAIGVRPNLEFLAGTEVAAERGVLTDQFMRTSVPNIYAAGDIAQTESIVSGESVLRALWLTAVQQGKVAGSNMAGVKEVYPGNHAMNSIQLFGLPIISLGEINGGPGVEEIYLSHPAFGVYKKLLVKDNCLTGLLFVGDVQAAGVLYHKLGQPLNKGYWDGLRVVGEENIVV